MANEVRTNVTIQLQTKGFSEAQKIADSAVSAVQNQAKGFVELTKGSKEADREIARLRGQVERLTFKQLALNRALEGVEKGSDAWKNLIGQLQAGHKEIERIGSITKQVGQIMDETWAKRKGFMQGLAQGAAPGTFGYLQRGPGMRHQMAGQFIGTQARRTMAGTGQQARQIGGAAAMTPFLGAQSMIQAVGAIPGIGAPMAATLGRAMGQAQQAIGYEQTRMATMPYLGGLGMSQQMGQAGRRAAAGAGLTPGRKQFYKQLDAQRRQEATLKAMTEAQEIGEGGGGFRQRMQRGAYKGISRAIVKGAQAAPGALGEVAGTFAQALLPGAVGGERTGPALSKDAVARATEEEIRLAKATAGKQVREQRTREIRATKQRAGAQARGKVQREWLGDIGGLGVQMGMALPEVRQFAGQVSQAGGGFGRELQTQQMLPAALGAQRLFGVQAQTAGAFLGAGRRGGLVGGMGRGGESLTESIQDALRLGLQGSEITDYVQQIAGGIQQWRQTGIPMNKESLADMTREMGQRGMGGIQGQRIAGGFQRAAEQISMTGPQSVAQLMALETLGGVKVGESSMEDIEAAMIRLEEKKFTGADIGRLIDKFMGAGGGKGVEGRRTLRMAMRDLGIQVTGRQIMDMTAGPEGVTPEQRLARKTFAEQQAGGAKLARKIEGPQGLAGAAAAAVPGALKAQAALTNKQISAGYKMIATMQNLERMAQRLTSTMAKHIGPTLGSLTGNMDNLTKAVLANTESWIGRSMQVGP